MPDYTVTITFAFSIEAPNEEKAQERAEVIAESLTLTPPKRKRAWWPDAEAPEVSVEEN